MAANDLFSATITLAAPCDLGPKPPGRFYSDQSPETSARKLATSKAAAAFCSSRPQRVAARNDLLGAAIAADFPALACDALQHQETTKSLTFYVDQFHNCNDTTAAHSVMDCLQCSGACCESFEIPLSDLDTDPSTERWIKLHGTETEDGNLELECRCTMLTDEGLCGIYETRPLTCRVYPAGGPDCLEAVRKRRTPEQYQRIRDEDDPERIYE